MTYTNIEQETPKLLQCPNIQNFYQGNFGVVDEYLHHASGWYAEDNLGKAFEAMQTYLFATQAKVSDEKRTVRVKTTKITDVSQTTTPGITGNINAKEIESYINDKLEYGYIESCSNNESIIFPVNMGGHWVQMTLNIDIGTGGEKNISLFYSDSAYGTENKICGQSINIKGRNVQIKTIGGSPTPSQSQSIQQDDGKSCGIIALTNGLCAAYSLNPSQDLGIRLNEDRVPKKVDALRAMQGHFYVKGISEKILSTNNFITSLNNYIRTGTPEEIVTYVMEHTADYRMLIQRDKEKFKACLNSINPTTEDSVIADLKDFYIQNLIMNSDEFDLKVAEQKSNEKSIKEAIDECLKGDSPSEILLNPDNVEIIQNYISSKLNEPTTDEEKTNIFNLLDMLGITSEEPTPTSHMPPVESHVSASERQLEPLHTPQATPLPGAKKSQMGYFIDDFKDDLSKKNLKKAVKYYRSSESTQEEKNELKQYLKLQDDDAKLLEARGQIASLGRKLYKAIAQYIGIKNPYSKIDTLHTKVQNQNRNNSSRSF